MNRKKRVLISVGLVLCFLCLAITPIAAEGGNVAEVIKEAWNAANSQIKEVVNAVVFPAVDMILAIFFFIKLGMAYFDYRKQGMFDWTTPSILFVCLIFTLTAPLYIWKILGM